jgi:hypothetical protein
VDSRTSGLTWEDVCAFAKTLPGVEEGTSYGTPALRVKRVFLARLRDDGETLVVPVDPEERSFLVEAHRDALFVTEHYERWPLVLVALPKADPGLVRELIEDAWSERASRRVVDAWLAERRGVER